MSKHNLSQFKTSSQTWTAYAWFHLKQNPFFLHPFQPTRYQTLFGRVQLRQQLGSILRSGQNVAITGESGIGKSSLLNQVAQDLQDATYIFRLSLSQPSLKSWIQGLSWNQSFMKNEVFQKMHLESELTPKSIQKFLTYFQRLKHFSVIVIDDLDKVIGDGITCRTRSQKIIHFFCELQMVLEKNPLLGIVASLPPEFYPPVETQESILSFFQAIYHIEKFSSQELQDFLFERLHQVGWKQPISKLLNPEALILAKSLSMGIPRRFLYLLSRGLQQAWIHQHKQVEFQDIFEVLQEQFALDTVIKKMLYFFTKSKRVVASNSDFQSFMNLDMVSLNRRLESLAKLQLIRQVDSVNGFTVYSIKGEDNSREDA
jgi:type II secretory pathway predicted ATPase ExeA